MFKKFAGGGNPLLRNSLQNESASTLSVAQEGTMTAQGAINKTLILFGILLITAIYNYQVQSPVLMIGGAIVGLILVLVNVFKKD